MTDLFFRFWVRFSFLLVLALWLRPEAAPVVVECKEKAPVEQETQPQAPDAVRTALCEAGVAGIRLPGGGRVLAGNCEQTVNSPLSYEDVLVGPDSLATTAVCNAWANGAQCPENPVPCKDASTVSQWLCGCKGNWSTTKQGTVLEGLFVDFRGADASACPPAAHNGCGLVLTLTRAQYHVLAAVATDDDNTAYPAFLKQVVGAIRADPQRTRRLADVPACLRGKLSVRAGRPDLEAPTE